LRRNVVWKRILYLASTALLAMVVLVPGALAQNALPGDDDPLAPEPHPVLEKAEIERVAGQPLPSQPPTVEPIDVPDRPPAGGPLPKTGGAGMGGAGMGGAGMGGSLAVVLPAGALLLGMGVLAYGVSRRR
jgi:hypothetical protein